MKKTMSMMGGAALGVLLWTGVASAQGPPPRGPRPGEGPGFGPPIERMAAELGLSDDQKAQLTALRDKNRDATKAVAESARTAHEAFDKALEADAADPATVGRLAIAMHAAQKKFDAARRAGFEEMKAILTPEQREKLEQGRPGFGPPPGGPGRPVE